LVFTVDKIVAVSQNVIAVTKVKPNIKKLIRGLAREGLVYYNLMLAFKHSLIVLLKKYNAKTSQE